MADESKIKFSQFPELTEAAAEGTDYFGGYTPGGDNKRMTLEDMSGFMLHKSNAGEALKSAIKEVSGADIPTFTEGGLYSETGIEYSGSSYSRTTFIKVEPNSYITFLFPFGTPDVLRVFEFADNTTTTQEVNTKLNIQYPHNGDTCKMSAQTYFIRIRVDAAPSAVTGVVLLHGGGYQCNQFLGLNYMDATPIVGTSDAHVDLNGYDTPGNYVVTSAALAACVDNAPLTNTGYKLVVMQTSGLRRIFQLLMPNTGSTIESKLYFRNRNTDEDTGWNPWVDVTNPQDAVKSSGISVTSSNYATYFPNAKFSDITTNTIIRIGSNVPLTDGPSGDKWIGMGDRTSGYVEGTLIVLTPRNHRQGDGAGPVQIFLGYRNTSYKPTLSYRVASYSNGEYVWSDWSKFEENGYFHAGNVVVYGGSLDKSISDLNDMPSNTIYQLDLNLNGSDADHTLAHHPAPGVSCVAMCYAYSYTTQHGKVQTVYTIDGRLYWRYGYLQATDDYRWTAWNQVVHDNGSFVQNRGRLENGTDLDTVITNSIYMLGAQGVAQYVHNPLESGAGFLTVKACDAVIFQVAEGLSGYRYSRYSTDTGTSWSNWVS